MALQLTTPYTTAQGLDLDATYWRWVGLGIDVVSTSLRAELYGYVSAEAFSEGKQSVGSKAFQVSGAAFGELVLGQPVGATLSDALSHAIYAYAKAHDPLFSDAVEV